MASDNDEGLLEGPLTEETSQQIMQVSTMILEAAEREVGDLCKRYGFGCVMQVAAMLWQEKAIEKGLPGSNHILGPCQTFAVPCFCRLPGNESAPTCDLCCGCGWLTKAVAELVENSKTSK